MTRIFQTKFCIQRQNAYSILNNIFYNRAVYKITWKIKVQPTVLWVRSSSVRRKTSVMRECVHIHTHTWRMGEFVSFQHIIMQAASKRPSESWKPKWTQYWTKWSTTQVTRSWPQAYGWAVVVAIVDIFDLFQPKLEVIDKLP